MQKRIKRNIRIGFFGLNLSFNVYAFAMVRLILTVLFLFRKYWNRNSFLLVAAPLKILQLTDAEVVSHQAKRKFNPSNVVLRKRLSSVVVRNRLLLGKTKSSSIERIECTKEQQ